MDAWTRREPIHAAAASRLRYDDPLGVYRTIYATSTRYEAYLAALAPFRQRPNSFEFAHAITMNDPDLTGTPQAGDATALIRSWISRQFIGEASLNGQFVDLTNEKTINFLSDKFPKFSDLLKKYPINDLNAHKLTTAPRDFTMEISRYIWELETRAGMSFDGLSYRSRIAKLSQTDDAGRRWAIFESDLTPSRALVDRNSTGISLDDPDLIRAFSALGLEPDSTTLVPRIEPPRSPTVPSELIDDIASGQAVLFVGEGLSVYAGFPAWKDVLRRMCSALGYEHYLREIDAGNEDRIRNVLAQDLGVDARLSVLKEFFGTSREIPQIFCDFASMPFAHAITATLDDTLERALNHPSRIVFADGSALDDALRSGDSLLIKLSGELQDPQTVRFNSEEFRTALSTNSTFAQMVASLVLSRTVVYVGATVEQLERLLSDLAIVEPSDRKHYAFITGTLTRTLSEDLLEKRYHITLLKYDDDAQFSGTVAHLARSVADRRAELSKLHLLGPTKPDESKISHVTLTNIGSFCNVTFELNPGWNVLLGINGAGKSTILKAIALCLCGNDLPMSTVGQQLLNSGAQRGSIALTIAGSKYTTDFVRERGRVRVFANRLTPLQRGTALALGFPALRGPSAPNPQGPGSTSPGYVAPDIADVAPLFDSVADRRLGNFKQWIVNLDARAERGDEATRKQCQRILELSFQAVATLSGNAAVRFARVDPANWQVLVSTADVAELPLDYLSQGMTSLLAWIGVALERFFEVHHESTQPEEAAGIILVDEIDAHLHPLWQRELIGVLKATFPNAQVIATTHSPLIVGSLETNEVAVVYRDPNEPSIVTLQPLQQRFKGLRVDQILATSAFDMPTTRDPESARLVDKYEALVFKGSTRSSREDEMLRKLAVELDAFFYAGDVEAERLEESIVDDPDSLVNRHLSGSITPEERARIVAAMATAESRDPS